METKDLRIKDILVEGKISSKDGFVFSEKSLNKIVIAGLFLPKDKVSRNKVLYDWSSIEAIHKKLIGLPTLYNHLNEGKEKPVGHFTDSVLLLSRPKEESKWQKVWDKTTEDAGEEVPGWYYEADINPSSEYADSVVRGDLRKVSIQAIANKAIDEKADDGASYTRAWIADILEGSVVPTPGFIQTSMEILIAESLGKETVLSGFPMKRFEKLLKVFERTVGDSYKAARLAIDTLENKEYESFMAIESLTDTELLEVVESQSILNSSGDKISVGNKHE